MALPTFNAFSFNDSNFIAERILFKGYAKRSVVRAALNRREGIKILGTEYGEKEVTIEGVVIASSSSDLQTKLDNMKKYLTLEEGDLVLETGRTFKATVTSLAVPDEHYNQSKAPFEVTFVCSNPYAEGAQISQTYPVISGTYTLSGTLHISGTMFGRPTVTYTPAGSASGNTLINRLAIYHSASGQTITVSGFGSGTGLSYANAVAINFDTLESVEGVAEIDSSGAFPKWEPGSNTFTVSSTGAFVGGSIAVTYKPRYL